MKKVSLEEILAFREKRARRREEILSQFPHPLAVLGLNIPGEYKDFPWARRCFRDGIEAFTLALEAETMKISHKEREEEAAGYSAFFSIDSGCAAAACDPAASASSALKTLALRIEEKHPLGRLLDIDVYEPGGTKLSRGAARPCLVCGASAFACGRSRAHAPEELRKALLAIMEGWLRQKLGDRICSAAMWAIMSEAAVTPKPGLVDRSNSGAHRDMDFFTFIESASALLPWFRYCAMAGFDSESGEGSAAALFESLRPPGKAAEVLMKKATGGVNSHRGYIFSLGILSAAYGRLFRNCENPALADLLELTRAMTLSLGEDFSRPGPLSHGEALYAKSGIPGIRGEVSRGFPTLTEHALPLLERLLKEGCSLNDAGSAVLLKILAHAQDSNFIHRGGEAAFRSIQDDLRAFFEKGVDMGAIREKAFELDREFISKNLSPGGSADLLGTAFFLYRLGKTQIFCY